MLKSVPQRIFVSERAADHLVDQADRSWMPVNLLMIPHSKAPEELIANIFRNTLVKNTPLGL
jgi:hypothetical protein